MQYTNAIAGLESITKSEQSALDMETADVLKANLTVIDGAITESRAALQTEPDNPMAQESLFDALRSKLELLQDVVSLINEMRKGNPEGAARIVSGLNQPGANLDPVDSQSLWRASRAGPLCGCNASGGYMVGGRIAVR